MDSDNLLFIVESPEMVSRLNFIFEEMDLSVEVIATHGDIFYYPDISNEPAINALLEDSMRHPLAKSMPLINEIKEKAPYFEFVIIATTNDEKGDLIASDIGNILKDQSNVLRMELNGLDYYNVERGMQASIKFDPLELFPQTVNRIFNRILNLSFKDANKSSLNLIQYAMLGACSKGPVNYAKLKLQLPSADGGSPYITEAFINKDNVSEMKHALMNYKNLPPVPVESTSIKLASQPWSLSECLINISEKIGGDPFDVYSVLKSLFISGEVTFSEIESKNLSIEAIKKIKKIAMRYGIKTSSSDKDINVFGMSNVDLVNAQSPTESIRPLLSDVDISSPLKLLPYNLAVLSVLSRNLILAGMRVKVEKPNISTLPNWAKSFNWERTIFPSLPWMESDVKPGIYKTDPVSSIMMLIKSEGISDRNLLSEALAFYNKGLVTSEMSLSLRGRDEISRLPKSLLSNHLKTKINDKIKADPYKSPNLTVSEIINSLDPDLKSKVTEALESAS